MVHFTLLFVSDGDGAYEEHAKKDRRSNQAYVSYGSSQVHLL